MHNLSYVLVEGKSGADKTHRVTYILGPIEERRTDVCLCSKMSFTTICASTLSL